MGRIGHGTGAGSGSAVYPTWLAKRHAFLKTTLAKKASRCMLTKEEVLQANLEIVATGDEIVMVRSTGIEAVNAKCWEEAAWKIRLPANYVEDYSYSLKL